MAKQITLTQEELDQMVNAATARAIEKLGGKGSSPNIQVVLDTEALANALVKGQKQVNEEAVVVNAEEKSRSNKRKEIEKELESFDNKNVSPYLLYSTELCPHAAPTCGGHDFPKYIIKRGGRTGTDVAAKKLSWLTDREAERIRRFAPLKFMEIIELDEVGNPVLDPRTNAPRTKRVPYSSFIRLVPTRLNSENKVMQDPAELVASLEAELAAYKGEKKLAVETPAPGAADPDLADVNKSLSGAAREAKLSETEAERRFSETLAKTGPTGVRV